MTATADELIRVPDESFHVLDVRAPQPEAGSASTRMMKNLRVVATRYGKRGCLSLGTATAAALVIWLRT
ncbi:hypothetical protein P376_3405 [Streptomyces sp. HCCB10043]|nr:hypothetical protein P376_3405 [Streptomyces sp. HCCB10043]EWS92319.1 hypothetical protein SSIG_02825 [Streptomyces filamentosus NRRL 11379]